MFRLFGLLVCWCFIACFGCKSQSKNPLPDGKITKIMVVKSKRELSVLAGDTVLKTYKICLGGNPEGPKTQQGDSKTPEGLYVLDYHNPNSSFYKSLHISYPNKKDRDNAKRNKFNPGGLVMLHGTGKYFAVSHATGIDWTDGCIALTDNEMDELFDRIINNTPIEILP